MKHEQELSDDDYASGYQKCKCCSRPTRGKSSIVCGDVCAALLTDTDEKKAERAFYNDDEFRKDRSL